MKTREKVVITEIIWQEGLDILSPHGEVIYDPDLWKKENLKDTIADATALVVRNQTQVNRSLIQAAPNLRVIGRLGVGLDNIDLAAARQRAMPVVYARNANAISVAEYVIAAIFHFARPLNLATKDVKQGNWNRKFFTRMEAYKKTLGLIGLGEISSRIASRTCCLGMNILGYDPFVPPYESIVTDLKVQLTSLEEVLSRSDFISLHVPLNDQTRYLINKETLSKMQTSAYIINSSRGGILDEQALYEALANHEIAGAALDVFEKEPPQDSPLLQLDNVFLTPHIAGLTEEAQIRTSTLVAEEIINVLNGRQSMCIAT